MRRSALALGLSTGLSRMAMRDHVMTGPTKLHHNCSVEPHRSIPIFNSGVREDENRIETKYVARLENRAIPKTNIGTQRSVLQVRIQAVRSCSVRTETNCSSETSAFTVHNFVPTAQLRTNSKIILRGRGRPKSTYTASHTVPY